MPKLIVIRGNSGSGKSTVAQKLREQSLRRIAWVEQDNIRRKIFKEHGGTNGVHIGMIEHIVEYSLDNGYDVVLEGILSFGRYGEMLKRLADHCPEHYFFYLDIPLEETFRRHQTRASSRDFGVSEMTDWYKPSDITGFTGEVVIGPEVSEDEAIAMILKNAEL